VAELIKGLKSQLD